MFKIAVIVFLLSNIIYANVLNYFKEAVRHLKYDKVYSLYKESKQLSQNAIKSSRYNNFSADITYTRTYAKGLRNGFIYFACYYGSNVSTNFREKWWY